MIRVFLLSFMVSIFATSARADLEKDLVRSVAVVMYGDECRGMGENQVEIYQVNQPGITKLYEVLCSGGAYNMTFAYFMNSPYTGTFVPVTFATPSYDIEYYDEDSLSPKPIELKGITTTSFLNNSFYDEQTLEIRSYTKWRGLGDASDSGVWKLQEGQFVLKSYEVDPTYDGKISHDALIKYN